MKINELTLTNVRGFKRAELKFKAGMNLIVGLNGQGKTTVLNMLCSTLGHVVTSVNGIRTDGYTLKTEDVRLGTEALGIGFECEVPGHVINTTTHKPRETIIAHEGGKVREGATETKPIRNLNATGMAGGSPTQIETEKQAAIYFSAFRKAPQVAIFFSTLRTVPSDVRTLARKAGGEQTAAMADSLSSRELRLADIAHWMEAQIVLGKDQPRRLRHLEALREAVSVFLTDCKNLRAQTKPNVTLLVDKKIHGKTGPLNVKQLSDGERNMLVVVLVIAQKLSQARPDLDDPIRESEAVIMIDELDLHLHPKWQRTVVEQLTKTFPKCQFIATTHSPQIVAAVKPEQIVLLTADSQIRPGQSLGMDSNWILRHIMGTDDRPPAVAQALIAIDKLIEAEEYERAKGRIAKIEAKYGGFAELDERRAVIDQIELLAE